MPKEAKAGIATIVVVRIFSKKPCFGNKQFIHFWQEQY
jgi:hypothetical protein